MLGMHRQKLITAGILWIGLCSIAIGQDPRFSQFYAVPLQNNPALNGVFEGRVRLSSNYRELYPGLADGRSFRTYAVSGENRFRVVNRDYVAMGISVRQDEVGARPSTRSQAMLGASFLKQLSGGRGSKTTQYLVAGFQTALEQYTIGSDNVWYSSQYDRASNSVDVSTPSGEISGVLRSSVLPDLNTGLLWYLVREGQGSIFLGLAGQHVLEPSIRFIGEPGTPLYRRITLQGGGEWMLSKQISLLPAAQGMVQGPHSSLALGTQIRYANRFLGDIALRTGLWAHLAGQVGQVPFGMDALSISALFETGRFNWGLSYDLTVSPLRRSNYGKGGVEFSIMYRQPARERFNVKCPRF